MRYIKIESFDNYISAQISLQRLRDEGINCYLENETIATIAPFLSNSIAGIGLMVFDSQVDRAKEILKDTQSGNGD